MGVDVGNDAVVLTTGSKLYSGSWSQAGQALDGGQLGLGRYYGELGGNVATYGVYGQVRAGVQRYNGEITDAQFSQAVGGIGIFQAAPVLAPSVRSTFVQDAAAARSAAGAAFLRLQIEATPP